jgi:hypothetical protein
MATYDRTLGTASYQSAADSRLSRRLHLDWGAIFGGAALGWGLLFLLSVVGIAIGFAAIDPYSPRPDAALDVGSGVWTLVAMLATAFLGAYFVVRISGDRRRSESLLHGGISWGLSMVAGALLALSAANVTLEATWPTPEEAARAMARAGGLAAGAALLALVASLFGALFAASRASGISIANEFRPKLKLGKTGLKQPPQSQAVTPPDLHRDDTTILPPTH